jgi:hypothetical protein
MGQYGNQPDFGTRAKEAFPTGDPVTLIAGQNLNSAALYIGTGGTLVCRVVGGNAYYGVFSNEGIADEQTGYTVFTNIPDGTFFPVIVNNVWSTLDGDPGTTCSNIVALY